MIDRCVCVCVCVCVTLWKCMTGSGWIRMSCRHDRRGRVCGCVCVWGCVGVCHLVDVDVALRVGVSGSHGLVSAVWCVSVVCRWVVWWVWRPFDHVYC